MRYVSEDESVKSGFTLVELSLSIVFISILSITIALVINDAVSSYQRGLILNKINSTGQSLVDDMRTAVLNSYTRSALQECNFKYGAEKCDKNYISDSSSGLQGGAVDGQPDNGYKMVFVSNTAKILDAQGQPVSSLDDEGQQGQPVSGAFCTGNYSYIWNSGYFFGEQNYRIDGEMASLKAKWPDNNGTSVEHTVTNFKLLKVKDDYRKVCRSVLMDTDYRRKDNSNVFDVTGLGEISEEPIDLLGNTSDSNIAIYDLYVAEPAVGKSRSNTFYWVSFILGTTQGGVNVLQDGNYCTPPENYSSYENFDYCSINKFNFAVQAIGG